MRRASLFAALLLVVTGPAAAQVIPNVQRTRMNDGDAMLHAFRDRVLLDTLAIWEDVALNPPQAYSRVKDILSALKIPVSNVDSAHGLLWNTGFVTRSGQLAGKANSQSLRCGFGPSGDHADQWRVTVAYAVYLRTLPGGGTRLGIAVIGQAKDIAGANSPAVLCNTKGWLESEIVKFVRNTPSP